METNQRKVGRPKASPRTGPLVLGEEQGRAKVSFEISDRAAAELAEYTQWVEECSGMTASEARFRTVDFALREIFRRDRVWQAKRRALLQSQSAKPELAVASPAAPRPTATVPPSLPPPTPRPAMETGRP